MTRAKSTDISTRSRAQPILSGVARALRGRRGLVLGAAALVLGVALNWNWLVAAGIAPILVALLPCAAMCALGLCMNRMGNQTDVAAGPTISAASTEVGASNIVNPMPTGPAAGAVCGCSDRAQKPDVPARPNETASERI